MKDMWKRIFTVITIMSLAMVIVACKSNDVNNNDNNNNNNNNSTEKGEAPVISGISENDEIEVEIYSSEVSLVGIVVTDAEDGNITDNLTIDGTYDLNTSGTYQVSLSVTDSDGNKTTTTVNIVVTSTDTEPVLLGVSDIFVLINSSFDKMEGISASDAEDGDITNSITVVGDVNTSTKGTYYQTYSVIDADKNEVSMVRRVFVVDNVKSLGLFNEYVYDIAPDDEVGRSEFENLWILGTTGRESDHALTQGGNAGILELEGSDLGVYDENPNTWAAGYFSLPQNQSINMKFALSNGGNNDGQPSVDTWFRVVILEEDGTKTIIEPSSYVDNNGQGEDILGTQLINDKNGWYRLKSDDFDVEKIASYDLSAFAGKDVLIILEQADTGDGHGEFTYISKLYITGEEIDVVDASNGVYYDFNNSADQSLDWIFAGTDVTDFDYSGITDWTACFACGTGDQAMIVLNGKDEQANDDANSWASINLQLGKAQLLSFIVSSDGGGTSNFRVFITTEDGNVTYLNPVSDNGWEILPAGYSDSDKRTYDLNAYSNQSVKLTFEFDQVENSNATRMFVDGIKVSSLYINVADGVYYDFSDSNTQIKDWVFAGTHDTDFDYAELTDWTACFACGSGDQKMIVLNGREESANDEANSWASLKVTLGSDQELTFIVSSDGGGESHFRVSVTTLDGTVTYLNPVEDNNWETLAAGYSGDDVRTYSLAAFSGQDVIITFENDYIEGSNATRMFVDGIRISTIVPDFKDVSNGAYYDFSNSANQSLDWNFGGTGETSNDYAKITDWTACFACGGDERMIVLSGKEDTDNDEANSWADIKVKVGYAQELSFIVSSDGGGTSNFRVSVITADGNIKYINPLEANSWELLAAGYSDDDVRTYSLAPYVGQEVTIKFEYDQADGSSADRMFIDGIRFARSAGIYDFCDSTTQAADWVFGGTGETSFDYAEVTSWNACYVCGGDDKMIVMSGKDDVSNDDANSWASINASLETDESLSFIVSSDNGGTANFRVAVITDDNTITYLNPVGDNDWEELPAGYSSDDVRNYDLSPFNNQTVTIKFEFDQVDGSNVTRMFFDGILIN